MVGPNEKFAGYGLLNDEEIRYIKAYTDFTPIKANLPQWDDRSILNREDRDKWCVKHGEDVKSISKAKHAISRQIANCAHELLHVTLKTIDDDK